jgi:imidazoleglycerol phosphate dehydratase HisB
LKTIEIAVELFSRLEAHCYHAGVPIGTFVGAALEKALHEASDENRPPMVRYGVAVVPMEELPEELEESA